MWSRMQVFWMWEHGRAYGWVEERNEYAGSYNFYWHMIKNDIYVNIFSSFLVSKINSMKNHERN